MFCAQLMALVTTRLTNRMVKVANKLLSQSLIYSSESVQQHG